MKVGNINRYIKELEDDIGKKENKIIDLLEQINVQDSQLEMFFNTILWLGTVAVLEFGYIIFL